MGAHSVPGLRFTILGTLQAHSDDAPVKLGGYRQRAVLAALLIHANRILPRSRLIELVWEEPPATVEGVLHNYISRLRAVLDHRGRSGWRLIRTHEAGYEFHIDPRQIDAGRFEWGVSEARRLTREGRILEAIPVMESALAEWRGRALIEFTGEPFAVAESARLEHARIAATEALIETELGLGRVQQALERVGELVSSEPLNESVRAQHIRALVAAGRQADALASFKDLRLRLADELGIDPEPQLQALHQRVLRQELTPIQQEMPASIAHRTNLPTPTTSFLGRQLEVNDIVELLSREDIRLLSLTGPGGIGKTRLALQAAAEAADVFPDGRWWVSLASIRDPALVLPSVAAILNVREQPGSGLPQAICDKLTGKRALVVLDNCEHLLDQAAAVVGIVRDAGEPTVLVTSRERLHLSGEQVWPVPALSDEDGEALFVARATSLDPSFAVTPAVGELCADLEELPLAIELAAARTSLFSIAQIRERLSDRLDLFEGERDADPRQRTLRAAIDWSYRLLSPLEQMVFRRFSVFVGGATLDAAESVCGADVAVLGSLLDKSLIRRRDATVGSRFWMLETVRAYATEALLAAGESTAVLEAHVAWYAAYVAELDRNAYWKGHGDPSKASTELARELPNARSALAAALSIGAARPAGDLLFGLWRCWLTQGSGHEARRAADAWLGMDRSGLSDVELAPGLLACGEILRATGNLELSIQLKHQLLATCRAHPDGAVHGVSMRQQLAPALLADLSQIALASGRVDEARSLAAAALADRRKIGASSGIGHALLGSGIVELVGGDAERAHRFLVPAAEAMTGTGDALVSTLCLAESEILLGDLQTARSRLLDCLEQLQSTERLPDVGELARITSTLAFEHGDNDAAAVLLGACIQIYGEAGLPITLHPQARQTQERMTTLLRARIGEDALEAATERGGDLTLEETLVLVSAILRQEMPALNAH